jgi:hypothetical protein
MREWLVQLKGHVADLEAIQSLFDSPELRVVEADGEYHMNGSVLDQFTTDDEVYSFATTILPRLNGAARLSDSGYRNIELTGVVTLREAADAKPRRFVRVSAVLGLRFTAKAVCVVDGGGEISRHPTEAEIWLSKGEAKPEIATALHIFAHANDWVGFYLMLDYIQQDVGGGKALSQKSWITRDEADEIERFTHTANNFRTLGIAARHAIPKFKPPDNPMTLDEAKTLIQKIMVKWLRSKMA